MSDAENPQKPADAFAVEACADDPAATEALMRLADGLAPVRPAASLRDRLLGSAATTDRLGRFTEAVAQMLDLGVEAARGVMAHIDDRTKWLAGPGPASSCWVSHGPSLDGTITGFVRVPAGQTFPEHTHLGAERMLILQGVCIDGVDGSEARSGAVLTQTPGTTHDFRVPPGGPDLLYLTVIHEGIDIGGTIVRPTDRPTHA
ncbi:MAG: cupin domain-containing protein [Myxococcota bacterium]